MKNTPFTTLAGLVVATMSFFPESATAVDGFADDVAFMKEHTDVVLLHHGDAAVAVAPARPSDDQHL